MRTKPAVGIVCFDDLGFLVYSVMREVYALGTMLGGSSFPLYTLHEQNTQSMRAFVQGVEKAGGLVKGLMRQNPRSGDNLPEVVEPFIVAYPEQVIVDNSKALILVGNLAPHQQLLDSLHGLPLVMLHCDEESQRRCLEEYDRDAVVVVDNASQAMDAILKWLN